MAEIVQNPELRYTSDTQMPLAEMVVQFPGLRSEDPPATLKVVGWGNLAQEIQENYREGDRVVLEGRLSMNTLDRPEGFKEKRAELTVQRIHRLGTDTTLEASSLSTSTAASSASSASTPVRAASAPSSSPATPTTTATKTSAARANSAKAPAQPAPAVEADFDDIPF